MENKTNSHSIFDRKLILGCALSSIVSVSAVYAILKFDISYRDERIEKLSDNCAKLTKTIESVSSSLEDSSKSLGEIKSRLSKIEDNSSYVFTTLSSLQKTMSVVKDKLHITNITEEAFKQLSPQQTEFIEAFSNLIKDGAPFSSFIESNSEKFDMKKYASSEKLLTFKDRNVKSLEALEKDYETVGIAIFDKKFEESFWEHQKRIIKEKFTNLIQFKKTDKNGVTDVKKLDDRSLFEEAGKYLADQKFKEACDILNEIKIDNQKLKDLLGDIKQRCELEDAFDVFKKEFVESTLDISEP